VLLLSIATGSAAAPALSRTNSAEVPGPTADDPTEREYEKLLEEDDRAQEEVDQWIKDDLASRDQRGGESSITLRARVLQRLEPVRKGYDDFLKRRPGHTRARLAYGSFLMDLGEEDEAVKQMEKAREIDPRNPAAWNNLANHYGHRGPVTNAFAYYAKAIELNPNEPVYYQNLATTVFLFRPDATNYYRCTEQQVFDRSLDLYRQALRLAPTNFVLAADYAMTFYGIKPARTEDALAAWRAALALTQDSGQRQGVHVHLARLQINAGRFDEARRELDQVQDPVYDDLKKRLLRNIEQKQNPPATNAPATPTPATPRSGLTSCRLSPAACPSAPLSLWRTVRAGGCECRRNRRC
jgi:tetratricopeptide (TPR) repeat protein